ncbi:MAG: family 20 glycosylhydrolase [Planctomycetota bacterium]
MRTLRLVASTLLPLLGCARELPAQRLVDLIPEPQTVFSEDSTAQVAFDSISVRTEDSRLDAHRSALSQLFGRVLPLRNTQMGYPVELALNPSIEGEEAYQLVVRPEGTRIEASTAEGIARGSASFFQLVDSQKRAGPFTIPAVMVADAPANDYRAVSLDVARQPHSAQTIRALIDLMWFYKVRYLQLHLTDDQAFTIPFPEITDALGGRGMLSIEAWKGLVAYGEARGVTLIPEFDLPGHSTQLKRSGYLEDPTPEDGLSDRDVAHPVNHEKVFRVIDAMREVFHTSPYFHIGGDESGAGRTLEPFLAAVNEHLRKPDVDRPPVRMIVWEGFHGTPESLPATGPDRILVASWESAYNPPWNLLDAGYELINASWKPLYVVGGGTPRYPHIGGRKWSAEDLIEWHKDDFWHWQAGTPVFEDRGPSDRNRDDGRWLAPAPQRGQILGGQLSFWEQKEHTVLRDGFERIPALAESLWSRTAATDFVDPVGFARRLDALDGTARAIAQPIDVQMVSTWVVPSDHPTADDAVWVAEGTILAFVGPTATSPLDIDVRFTRDGSVPSPNSERADILLGFEPNEVLHAQAFLGGEPIGAPKRVTFDTRPALVRCSWFDLPRRAFGVVPDFSDRGRWTPSRVDLLPELRGPYRTTHPVGQSLEAAIDVPADQVGEWEFRLKTRDGRAVLYVDGERKTADTDPGEQPLFAKCEFAEGVHTIRVDHASGPISPVVLLAVKVPGSDEFVGIERVLATIPRDVEPEFVTAPSGEVDLLANGLEDWRFVGDAEITDVATVGADRVLRIAGRPQGYLETKRWHRDYQLDLEWRWPERPGNSGVLVHVTAPRMFYGWPRSLEVQLASGRAGDFWTIGDDISIRVEDAKRRVRPWVPGDLHSHRRIPRLRDIDEAAAEDGWNRMSIRCEGDEIVVLVNGMEVQRGDHCSVQSGAIALQSEGTPIEFRNLRLRPLARQIR